MRGRKPMPDGRRNTFSAKLSDAEAASVNAAIEASGLKPAVWVREKLVAAAAHRAGIPARVPRVPVSDRLPKAPPPGRPAHSPTCKCLTCRPPKQ